jgi:quinol-cytochrome oxidoreductase complex cytochrome b subunit
VRGSSAASTSPRSSRSSRHFGFVYTPVDASRPVREVVRELATEPVPSYTRGPRILGLLAAILFGLQAVTGVLLAYYYRPRRRRRSRAPAPSCAICPPAGSSTRCTPWGAYLLVAVIVLRMLRFFWDGLYRAPRELCG